MYNFIFIYVGWDKQRVQTEWECQVANTCVLVSSFISVTFFNAVAYIHLSPFHTMIPIITIRICRYNVCVRVCVRSSILVVNIL